MAQKLVIPRGIIDPEETTVINIPHNLRGSSVVIAKKSSPGTPGSSGPQGSFYTPPPRGYEHPSLDYPAFMDKTPDLPSFYRILPQGENWNQSWSQMPEKRPKSPGPVPLRPEGAPDLPVDYWSPTKRSTPCYKPGFNTQDLKAPRRRLFGDDFPPGSPIESRAHTLASTIQPKTREFPSVIYDRSELRALEGTQDQTDSAEENIEEEEEDAEEEEAERLHALDQLEFCENDTLVQDLLALQRERRKVVYDLANMEPTRKSSLKKLLAPLKALKKLKKKMLKKKKSKKPQ